MRLLRDGSWKGTTADEWAAVSLIDADRRRHVSTRHRAICMKTDDRRAAP
jgi:hypothetical protein